MKLREIGRSGIHVSAAGLGCNNFGFFQDTAQCKECVHAALDAGITFFDMASEHGAGAEEALVGKVLRGHRHAVVIATKFGQPELLGLDANGGMQMRKDPQRQGMSRRWIMQTVEESLRRLGTDYIDLYQPHVVDATVPADETLRALDELVQQGKVRAIGQAATFATAADVTLQQDIAMRQGLSPFSSMQTHYNLLMRDAEREILPMLRARHMSLLPYWPLANGLLSGKYNSAVAAAEGTRLAKIRMVKDLYGLRHWRQVELLRSFALSRGMDMVELSFAWLLSEDAVASVIAGASSAQQVAQNAKAADSTLSPSDRCELLRLLDEDMSEDGH